MPSTPHTAWLLVTHSDCVLGPIGWGQGPRWQRSSGSSRALYPGGTGCEQGEWQPWAPGQVFSPKPGASGALHPYSLQPSAFQGASSSSSSSSVVHLPSLFPSLFLPRLPAPAPRGFPQQSCQGQNQQGSNDILPNHILPEAWQALPPDRLRG